MYISYSEILLFFPLTLQVILGEEVAASKLTLFDITKQICDAVQARAVQGSCPATFMLYFDFS